MPRQQLGFSVRQVEFSQWIDSDGSYILSPVGP